jgi:CRISPR/Cas system-associated endonuclease Cas1
MLLVINTYGAYLRKSGNCFLVKREDKSFEVAVNKVNSILITTAAYITTDAIKLAVDNNIDIVFLDAHGDPYGRGLASQAGQHHSDPKAATGDLRQFRRTELSERVGTQEIRQSDRVAGPAEEDQRGEKRRASEIYRRDRKLQRADEEAAGHHRCPAAGHAGTGGQGLAGLLRGALSNHAGEIQIFGKEQESGQG